MSFVEPCRTALGAGVVAWALTAPVLARDAPQPATVAFTHVTVIPMDHEGVAPDRTVLVRGGRIVAVGSGSQVEVPSDAMVIDGTGQYLVPGLTDAHVHLSGTPLMPTREDFGDAPMYLAYGVTTVVNLSGSPEILEWRTRVAAGTLLGPTIYTAGPFVNEPRVNTPDDVERDIRSQAQFGYDLIKFHELLRTTTGLSRPAYHRMADTARRIGVPLVGHSPTNLGLDDMLQARQAVAHMGMVGNLFFLPFTAHPTVLVVTAIASVMLIGMSLASAVTALGRRFSKPSPERPAIGAVRRLIAIIALATAGAFVCALAYVPGGPSFDSVFLRLAFTALAAVVAVATLMTARVAVRLLPDAAASTFAKAHALLAVASAVALTGVLLAFWVPVSWRSSEGGIDGVAKRVHDAGIVVQSTLIVYDTFSTSGRTALIDDPAHRFLMPSLREAWRGESRNGIPLNRLTSFNQKVAGVLHRHGVPIMAGTDAMGLPLVAPGSSLHRELELLSASGLSPYEVIRSATVVPAAFLGRAAEFGTITAGKRADLLLVAGNPLHSLEVLKRPRGVMVRGRWLPRQRLDELLESLATASAPPGAERPATSGAGTR